MVVLPACRPSYRDLVIVTSLSPSDGREESDLVAICQQGIQSGGLPDIPAVNEYPGPDAAILAEDSRFQPRLTSHTICEGIGDGHALALHVHRAFGAGYPYR